MTCSHAWLRSLILVCVGVAATLGSGCAPEADADEPIGLAPTDCEDEGCACGSEDAQLVCGTDVGACTTGVRICREGVWGACEAAIDPVEETCNGKDDDCDGTPDQGCPCVAGETRACGDDTGECAPGTQTCEAGVWGACASSITPAEEICDGLDNDCDGSIDEGGNGCGGACELMQAPGSSCDGVDADLCSDDVVECAGPNAVVCTAGTDNVETFDRTDQDCNGIVDDGYSVLAAGYNDITKVSGSCPTGYAQRGSFKFDSVANNPPYASAVTWDGTPMYAGWLRLCSPTDAVILANGAGSCPAGYLDRGSFRLDGTAPTLSSGSTYTGASLNGGQWLRLCSRTTAVRTIVGYDDLTKVSLACPAGTVERGRWKPDQVASTASPSGYDTDGRAVRSGWLRYCAPP